MKKIIQKISSPHATCADLAKQEYFLNLILLFIILLILSAIVFNFIKIPNVSLINYDHNQQSFILIGAVLIFYISLLVLSKYGHSRLSTYLLLSSLFLIASKLGLRWGADLPVGILLHILIIILSGVLINGKISILVTLLCSATFVCINYLHAQQIVSVDRSWINQQCSYSDIIITSIILLIIAMISWLSNREIKKAIDRALTSELELEFEKNNREIKMAARTKELEIIQAEKIAEVHRFAEFGKLSSGLFHDLVNPLTAVILNVGKIKEDHQNNCHHHNLAYDLDQALKASNKMGAFINAVRKQIKAVGQNELFCLNQEIEEIISVLNYKATASHVAIKLITSEKINLLGDPIKFNQIITNLLSNAIDASLLENIQTKEVLIFLKRHGDQITLSVKDFGHGINSDHFNKIFEPFFTTKSKNDGLGLGLSLIKNIIEKNFKGTIEVKSELGIGSEFVVKIPILKSDEFSSLNFNQVKNIDLAQT